MAFQFFLIRSPTPHMSFFLHVLIFLLNSPLVSIVRLLLENCIRRYIAVVLNTLTCNTLSSNIEELYSVAEDVGYWPLIKK